MDRIINWLLLTIIFVFDPLAIALVVAANFAFEQVRPRTKKNLYREDVIIEEDDEEENEKWVENGYMGEDEAEKRMDIIGQNGNTGEHYEESPEPEAITSIDDLTVQELQNLLSITAKTNKYGPKGWKTIQKRIDELKAENNDDDLIIKY